jgi:hypothetical protein
LFKLRLDCSSRTAWSFGDGDLYLGYVRFIILPHRHLTVQIELADGRGNLIAVAGDPAQERIVSFWQPLV